MQLAQFMFLFKKNQLPCIFNEMFIVNAEIHSYETGSSNKFHLPSVKTTFLQRNIYFSGPSLWNLLPNDIVSCSSLYSFKSKLKQYLISYPTFKI